MNRQKSNIITHCVISILLLPLLATAAFASEYLIEDLNRDENKQQTWMVLPYMFSSDSMGFTVGAVGIMTGFLQPQMTMVATTFIGEEQDVNQASSGTDKAQTSGIMLGVYGYNPSFADRLFINAAGVYAYYPNQRLYLDGSNDSVKNLDHSDQTPLQTQGYSNWFNADFRYILPWGESKTNPLPTIQLRRGIAVNRENFGGGAPFETGQTTLGTELFYSKWSAEKFTQDPSINSNGLRLYLDHDNTDYPANPSRGYTFNAKVSADFGIGNSTQSWNALEFDYSHYFELQNFSWSRQNVIAMNFWTAYSPSWDSSEKNSNGGILDNHQTPMWEGARLGGWSRLRAYDSNRFNDKAAIYGAAEYRMIPSLNPMADQKWNPIPIDWFQVVLFAEVGRVDDQYGLSLLSDMKYDIGFSFRALAAKVPVRFDVAFGEEGSAMWVMLNQPF